MAVVVRDLLVADFGVVDRRVVGVPFNERENFKTVVFAAEVQIAVLVGFEHLFFLESFEIAEHHPMVHVVAVDDAVGVREVAGVGAVEERTSRKGKVAFGVGVQVFVVIGALRDRIIDLGAVDLNPADDFRVEFLKGFKGNVWLGVGFVGFEDGRRGCDVNLVRVPEAVDAEGDEHHEKDQQEPVGGVVQETDTTPCQTGWQGFLLFASQTFLRGLIAHRVRVRLLTRLFFCEIRDKVQRHRRQSLPSR